MRPRANPETPPLGAPAWPGVLALAWLVLGCAGPSRPRRNVASGAHPPRRAPPSQLTPLPGRPFAATPITSILDELTDLALAGATGQPFPATQAPLRSSITGSPVRWHTTEPRARLSVIGVALEVELILKRGVPDERSPPAQRWGSIRLTLVLTRNGLRIASMRPRTMSRSLPGGRLPDAMSGLEPICAQVLAAIRAGDVSAFFLDEADRALLHNDEVWARAQADRVQTRLVAHLRAMLLPLPSEPLAYRLDDVAVLVRDGETRLMSLGFEWDAQGDSFVLETAPLLEVRQLWPL